MSFRIDAYNRATPAQVRNDVVAGAGQVKRPGVAESGAAAPQASGDKVSVSQEARRLAEQQSTKTIEQLDKLRAAIQSGSFKVDPGAIASRIVHGD
jgi:flagellar biosynthesis anti-sigma factor FlgM